MIETKTDSDGEWCFRIRLEGLPVVIMLLLAFVGLCTAADFGGEFLAHLLTELAKGSQ